MGERGLDRTGPWTARSEDGEEFMFFQYQNFEIYHSSESVGSARKDMGTSYLMTPAQEDVERIAKGKYVIATNHGERIEVTCGDPTAP